MFRHYQSACEIPYNQKTIKLFNLSSIFELSGKDKVFTSYTRRTVTPTDVVTVFA